MISAPNDPPSVNDKKVKQKQGWYSALTVASVFIVYAITLSLCFYHPSFNSHDILSVGETTWYVVVSITHIPYFIIIVYLIGGLTERFGFIFLDMYETRTSQRNLPAVLPNVCVQLAMYNEECVSERLIEQACKIDWPSDKLEIQVLDDSTDVAVVLAVDACVVKMKEKGVNIYVRRRIDRKGYKAGALEEGRKITNAEYLALFDADFMPTCDFLKRALPHFYKAEIGSELLVPVSTLALVQTRWGHLNPWQNWITTAQTLWIDDHHSVQMQWRSDIWNFVNFTGTAGLWRASAIEAAGGWRSASLVEDCELSFRVLFAGYTTLFDSSIVQCAELPDSLTAYKAQQKRWTQGWVQLGRLHLYHLVFTHKCSVVKRIALIYHMVIVWQWPAWTAWLLTLPFLTWYGLLYDNLNAAWTVFYLLPMFVWLVLMTVLATWKARSGYDSPLQLSALFFRTFVRFGPYMILNTGMLPHQFCSFVDGLLEPMHSEFERTPKRGNSSTNLDAISTGGKVSSPRKGVFGMKDSSLHKSFLGNQHYIPIEEGSELSDMQNPMITDSFAPPSIATPVKLPARNISKIHWYFYVEVVFIMYNICWAILFFLNDGWLDAFFFLWLGTSVLFQVAQYGDDR